MESLLAVCDYWRVTATRLLVNKVKNSPHYNTIRKTGDLPKKYFFGYYEGQPLRFEAIPGGYGKEL